MKLKVILGLALVVSAATLNGQSVSPGGVPREVLAFYYPWYGVDRSGNRGRHWGDINAAGHEASATPHYPACGVYN